METVRSYLGRDARREQILRVARSLFAEAHYEAVSVDEIARAAGVARGLINHYFGTKRELFREVVRSMLTVPDNLFAGEGSRDERISAANERWLRAAERNRVTWLATAAGPGIGSDPLLEPVLREARDRITDQLVAFAWGPPQDAPPEVRMLLEGYRGFAEAITAEWLRRRAPEREVVHSCLVRGLIVLLEEVLPTVQA